MTLLETLTYYKTAVFYYVLGGVTFLPICALLIAAHFLLTAPPFGGAGSAKGSAGRGDRDADAALNTADVIGEGELSEERKRQALTLAAWNRDAQIESKRFQEKQQDDAAPGDGDDSGIPTAAKRVKPAPQPPRKPHMSGWLTVRRHFQNDGVNLALQQAAQQALKRTSAAAGTSANGEQRGPGYMSMMYRGMLNYRGAKGVEGGRRVEDGGEGKASGGPSTIAEKANVDSDTNASQSTTPSSDSGAPSTTVPPQISAAKETFHCILKGPILYLYTSADPASPDTECVAAIDVRQKRVSIYVNGMGDTIGEPEDISTASSDAEHSSDEDGIDGGQGKAPNGRSTNKPSRKGKEKSIREGELFVKRNAVRIVSMGSTQSTGNAKTKGKYAQWFIFAKNAYLLEDWYHAIYQASTMPEGSEEGPDLIAPVFVKDDMANLLGTLDSVPDPIPLRWLNAMVGRIFFSIYRTSWLEDYIANKIRLKMSRVRTPSYLSNIQVREIDLGSTAPAFSRPILKSLTGDGEASMEVDMQYRGSVRLTISTVLTISLGQRFKQYSVTLILAVILNSLEGNLLLQIKPPPSNRIWFGFTKLPKMDISVEPVVSERKVQWSMVKRIIESRIRELLVESIVVPNMDDIPFFDSRKTEHRGGIWADAAKESHRVDLQSTAREAEDASVSPPEADPAAAVSQSKSTPASVMGMPVGDDQGTSSAVDTPETASKGVRSRRPVGMMDGVNGSDPTLQSTSPAAAGLTALLARDQAASSTRSASASGSGNLLSTWGKAKASMADRDSRHAAAKDAKDAMKRGWANWSSRRQVLSRTSTATEDNVNRLATLSTSSDRLGESSSAPTTTDNARAHRKEAPTSSWMASSPEDPASLGAGLDVSGLTHSPSLLSLDTAGDEENDGPSSSRASSVSGRKPYRQHRADKKRRDTESLSQASSRASSVHSLDRTPLPPPIPMRPDLRTSETIGPSSVQTTSEAHTPSEAWIAAAPGLTEPLPAARRESTGDTLGGDYDLMSTSPSSSVRRNLARSPHQQFGAPHASGEAIGSPELGRYSFLPGQALATTGLSSIELPTVPAQDASATPIRQRNGILGEVQRNEGSSMRIDGREGSPQQRQKTLGELAVERSDVTTAARASEGPTADAIERLATTPPLSPSNQRDIKQQPTRAPMMAVPGIPSMQKAGPQSFQAPTPPALPERSRSTATLTDADAGKTAEKAEQDSSLKDDV